MEIYVCGADRSLLGSIQMYESFRWNRKYSTCGSFSLKAYGSDDNAALLQIGHWLRKSDDDELGIIEHIELSQSEKEYITVSGRFATGLMARRIIMGTETYNGYLSGCIGELISNHLILPADEARMIAGIDYSAPNFPITVRTHFSHRNLLDVVTELLTTHDIGIKTVFNPSSKQLTITLYQGQVTQAIFSREYENILSMNYTHNISNHRDTCLVAGEGEGAERVTILINGATGIDRQELYVDARDLQSENFNDETDYTNALIQRGQSKLAEHPLVRAFDAEISMRGNLLYKSDYDVGSIVTVQSKKWGVSMQTRITEAIETYDGTGMNLDVTFGRGMLTLSQRLKEVLT